MENYCHTRLLSLFLVLAHIIGHYFVIKLISFHNEMMTTVQYGTSALFVSYSPGEENKNNHFWLATHRALPENIEKCRKNMLTAISMMPGEHIPMHQNQYISH